MVSHMADRTDRKRYKRREKWSCDVANHFLTQNKGNKEINTRVTRGAETKKKFTGSYIEVNPTEVGICTATKP